MLEQALGQMGKELPEELTKRMSLNRFFAMQRDIVNDELESLVPDLIEDALENPTGSYQIVTKEQTRKLDQINKSNDEILTELGEIKKLLKKKIGGKGEDGSLLGSLLDMIGLGGAAGLGAKALTRKGRDKDKNKKKPKFKKGKGIVGALLGLAAGGYLFGDELTGLDPGQAARDLGFGGLGDGIDTALDYGQTGLISGAAAYAKIKADQFAKTPPTATQTTSNYNNVVKDERLKGTKYYTKDPITGKTKLISMAEGAAAEASGGVTYKGGATPTATPATPKTSTWKNISNTFSKAKESTISNAKWLGGKLVRPAVAALAIWQAWSEIKQIDQTDMSRNEYRAEVARIIGNVLSEFGITLVSAGIGWLAGATVGAAATFFLGGAGGIPLGFIGFVSGLLGGIGLEYAIGDKDEEIINKVVDYTFGVGEYKEEEKKSSGIANALKIASEGPKTDTISGGAVNLAAGAQMPTKTAAQTATASSTIGNGGSAAATLLRKQRAKEESAKNRKEGAAAMAGLATETGNILFPGRDGVTKDELLVDEYNKLVRTGKVPQTLIDNLKEDMKNTKGLGTTIARAKIRSYTEDYVLADAPKNIIADEKGVRSGPEPTATPVTNEADLPAVNASPSSGLFTPPVPEPAKDERSWWQKLAPSMLGGKEAPGAAEMPEGSALRGVMGSLASLGNGEMAAGGATASGLFSSLSANKGALSDYTQLGMDKAKGLGGGLASLALGGNVTGDKLKQLGVIAPDASKEEVDAAVKQYSDMTKNAGPSLSPQQMASETGTSQTAIQNMFAPSGRTVSETTIDNNPNAEFQKMIDQMMTNFQAENTGAVNNINAPAMSTSAMPKFTDLQTPVSMAITALRAQGLADVYSHHQAGSTIERSNRGGETTYI